MIAPCINKCHIDTMWNICVSCGRTLWEIEDWVERTEVEQIAAMGVAESRLAEYNKKVERHIDFDMTPLSGKSGWSSACLDDYDLPGNRYWPND